MLFLFKFCVTLDRDEPPEERQFFRHFTFSKLKIRQYSCTLSNAPEEKIAGFRVRSSFVVNKILLYQSLQNAVILPYYKALQQRYREILSVKTDLSLSGVTLNFFKKQKSEPIFGTFLTR